MLVVYVLHALVCQSITLRHIAITAHKNGTRRQSPKAQRFDLTSAPNYAVDVIWEFVPVTSRRNYKYSVVLYCTMGTGMNVNEPPCLALWAHTCEMKTNRSWKKKRKVIIENAVYTHEYKSYLYLLSWFNLRTDSWL